MLAKRGLGGKGGVGGGTAYVFGGGIKHRRHPYGGTRPPTGLVVDGKRLPDGVITNVYVKNVVCWPKRVWVLAHVVQYDHWIANKVKQQIKYT